MQSETYADRCCSLLSEICFLVRSHDIRGNTGSKLLEAIRVVEKRGVFETAALLCCYVADFGSMQQLQMSLSVISLLI